MIWEVPTGTEAINREVHPTSSSFLLVVIVGTVDPEVAVHVLLARYVEAGATVVQIGEAVSKSGCGAEQWQRAAEA